MALTVDREMFNLGEDTKAGDDCVRNPRMKSTCTWYRVTHRLDCWAPPCNYGDALRTERGLEWFRVLLVAQQGQKDGGFSRLLQRQSAVGDKQSL